MDESIIHLKNGHRQRDVYGNRDVKPNALNYFVGECQSSSDECMMPKGTESSFKTCTEHVELEVMVEEPSVEAKISIVRDLQERYGLNHWN